MREQPSAPKQNKPDLSRTIYADVAPEGRITNISNTPRFSGEGAKPASERKEPSVQEVLDAQEGALASWANAQQNRLRTLNENKGTFFPGQKDPMQEKQELISGIERAENQADLLHEGRAALLENRPVTPEFQTLVNDSWQEASRDLASAQAKMTEGRSTNDAEISRLAAKVRAWHTLKRQIENPS